MLPWNLCYGRIIWNLQIYIITMRKERISLSNLVKYYYILAPNGEKGRKAHHEYIR